VIGLSGCGKSSLVKAGMLPALKAGFLSGIGMNWRVATRCPGDRPMRNLSDVLLNKSALGTDREGRYRAEEAAFLLATLRRGPLGLVEVLDKKPLPENTNLLILVDQFEEIFRYSKKCDVDEANAFVALLLASVEQTKYPVFVMLTMRSDFLGECPFFLGLPEKMNDNQFLTPRLNRDQCRAAIVGPADIFGGNVEPRLINSLLNEMGTDSDQLPVLQHCLMRMWFKANERIKAQNKTGVQNVVLQMTLADYEGVGGLKNALSNHADEAYSELDGKQQYIAERIFRCLSERGVDRRDTRRPAQIAEIASVAGVSDSEVITVANVFRGSDRCFVTPAIDIPLSPDSALDISHESLIRKWARMQRWVEHEVESTKMYRRLEEAACLWEQGRAALWRTPDLENAIEWRDREKPTPV
jgi:hypothetical protein